MKFLLPVFSKKINLKMEPELIISPFTLEILCSTTVAVGVSKQTWVMAQAIQANSKTTLIMGWGNL